MWFLFKKKEKKKLIMSKAWKGYFISNYLLSSKFKNKRKKEVWSRSSTIPAALIGHTVLIHNGKTFIKSYITREKVGFKFGDFALTRKFTRKIPKNKNLKKK
jgi:small subunit ribosomal protein S19